jgi:hypothetical protein
LRRLAETSGVASRLSVDLRAIDPGETRYLLAHAAALLELAPAAFVAPQHLQTALSIRLPVISCRDGGAVAEIQQSRKSPLCVEPSGSALAKAVRAAVDQGSKDASAASPRPSKASRASGWTPLLKALAA